ncbi:MAG: HipA domain-containing protein [Planctomycetota bacterium]
MTRAAEPLEPRAVEALDVFVDDGTGVDQLVGRLARTALGCELRYVSAALDSGLAVSHRLPVRVEPYVVQGVNLPPYFAGLLPEGLRMRVLVSTLKTSEDDLFTLLAAVGGDTVGAVTVAPSGAATRRHEPRVDLGSAELDFRQLLEESLGRGAGAAIDRRALAGVQPKVSAARLTLPVRAARTDFGECILKLELDDLPRLVANERFFMTLAREVGVEAARVRTVTDVHGSSALLAERFDRSRDRTSGRVLKLAQEDACQLLGRYPADKYRIALREFAEALEVCAAPLVARLELLRLVAFSYLIANGDLHAKNLSVRSAGGIVGLAPAYDLLSTLPYGDDRMALKLEGRDQRLGRRDFVAFGERVGVRASATERMLTTLVTRLGRRLADASKPGLASIGLAARATDHLQRTIDERCLALG